MKIKSVKASRIPGRAVIYFDDGRFLVMSLDEAVTLHLRSQLEIDQALLDDLITRSFHYLLLNSALNQIALSAKLKRTLILKLKQKYTYYSKKYDYKVDSAEPIIDRIVTSLEERGLLNENDYVQSVFRRYHHKPRSYIYRYLLHLGIDPKPYSPLFRSIQDKDLLTQTLASKKYQNLRSADAKTKNRLIASLIRKGFAYDDIKSAIDYWPSD